MNRKGCRNSTLNDLLTSAVLLEVALYHLHIYAMLTILVETNEGVCPQGLADVVPQYLAYGAPPGVHPPDHLIGDDASGDHVILPPRARSPGVALTLNLRPEEVAPE